MINRPTVDEALAVIDQMRLPEDIAVGPIPDLPEVQWAICSEAIEKMAVAMDHIADSFQTDYAVQRERIRLPRDWSGPAETTFNYRGRRMDDMVLNAAATDGSDDEVAATFRDLTKRSRLIEANNDPPIHREKHGHLKWFFLSACVARPVSRKEAAGNQKAVEDSGKEWTRLIDKDAWDYSVIREWGEIVHTARRKQQVHLGRIFGIMVEKGSELPKDDPARKFKYRVCFQGSNVVDQNWEAALFQDLGSSPAGMEASKAADCYGSFAGNDVEQSDAEQAYVQAFLEGVETWISLPDECINSPKYKHLFFRKDGSRICNRPCVKLKDALYGHPDAGSCWERHCDRRMKAKGFKPLENWPSCYFHGDLKLILMIYVDDFKLAGPKANLSIGWKMIQEAVEMGRTEPTGLFLGCMHQRIERPVKDGTKVRGIEYDMESFLTLTCKRYVDMVENLDPKRMVNLSKIDIPFLEDDSKCAPARGAIGEFPAVARPHCDATFPIWEEGKAPPHLCGGREHPKDWNGRLPFGSKVF